MKTIYKYPLTEQDVRLSLPIGAEFLDVQIQRGIPTLWYLVDTEKPTEQKIFKIVGTGWEIDEESYKSFSYLGTVTVQQDFLVWHIFERKNES